MPTIQTDALIEFSQAIFEAAGTPSETAQIVAGSLVKSNLLGHDSHGVQLIPQYVKRIQSGELDPAAQPRVERQRQAVAMVDGEWGFGQVIARYGTRLAGDLARTFGVGCVALNRSHHIGRLGEYAEMLADEGLVGLIMTGISGHSGAVAPFGGRERIFGTNPIAWGLPVPDSRPPLVLDFATSRVAYGKVMVALSKGVEVPEGVLLDKEGNPTTNPADLLDEGVLLPFGEHKGSGLMLMVELLSRGLAGLADASSQENRIGNTTMITAYAVDAFLPLEQFVQYTDSLLARIQQSSPAAGFEAVLLPGEPEARSQAQRSQAGIPIPEKTWQVLTGLGQELGLERGEG